MIIISIISLAKGSVYISNKDIWLAIFQQGEEINQTIIRDLRLPRLIASLLVGSSLGMRGGRCINFTPSREGCANAYRSCSQAVSRFRDGDEDAEFNDEERESSMPEVSQSPRRYNLRMRPQRN